MIRPAHDGNLWNVVAEGVACEFIIHHFTFHIYLIQLFCVDEFGIWSVKCGIGQPLLLTRDEAYD